MSVTITIDLANITRPEVLAVRDFLTNYDALAMRDRIDAGEVITMDETIREAAMRLANKEAERRPIPSQLPVAVPGAEDLGKVGGENLSAPGRVDEKAPANEPEVPKAKRGRPAKVKEVAAEPVDPTPQTGQTLSPSTSPSTTASEPPAVDATPTLDALRSALMGYTDRHDVDAGLALLKQFSVERVSELTALPVEKQIEFLEKSRA